jgi:asparagine synthase (glutamine-hydrolysing)
MASKDGRHWMVFNGEVYNYVELRSELERAGHAFHTTTDTEVVLAAYREWGAECLYRFIGMWALCIWDSLQRSLFLARDPFGIKPLYYWSGNGAFAFASEIKALLEFPGVARGAHPQHIYDYLRFGWTDHGSNTFFANIHQVPSGHWMTVSVDRPDKPRIERYWELRTTSLQGCSRQEAASRLRKLFLDSVNLHLRSDVSVGSALSGGIDSSSIVTGIRHLHPEAVELATFSHIDADPVLSEERWVDLITRAARARARKVTPRPEDLLRDIAELVHIQDQPFASTSIYAQFRVFRLAQEHGVKVMLDGQGADELFGGYPSYVSARLASLIGSGHWIRALQLLLRAVRLPSVEPRSTLVRTGGLLLPRSLEPLARTLAGENFIPSWMDRGWVQRHGVVPTPLRVEGDHNVLRAQLREALLKRSLPGLLRYEDRNSMASSVESRVPFLTTEIATFVHSLPEEYLIDSRGTSKSALREAMRGIVPDPVLERREKIGFATSEHTWLNALRPALQTTLEGGTAAHIPALRHDVVRTEAEGVLNGTKRFDFRLWRWLSLIWWTDQYSVRFER